jgi:DNA-3-methyladenine glycosylase II
MEQRALLNLDKLKDFKDVAEVISELCRIRGIEVWAAEFTAVRGMQKLEAMPADDLGLRRSISYYYCGGRNISIKQARKIAEKWGNWKGLAGFYLIVAARMGLSI